MHKSDVFYRVVIGEGTAVCAVLGDPWMLLDAETRAADSGAFAAFLDRQRENLLRIAQAAEEGKNPKNVSAEERMRTAAALLAAPVYPAFYRTARDDVMFASASLAEVYAQSGDTRPVPAALSLLREKLRMRGEERAFRAYVTDALRLLTENTAKMSGGGYLREQAASPDSSAADMREKICAKLRG